MARFHHVNLGVPPEQLDAEATFLIDLLGYRPVKPDERLGAIGARWYETADGAQVHLSADPDHRPAARAHVAIEFGPELADVEERLRNATVAFDQSQRAGFPRVLNCRDPAGNLWELRGDVITS
jgi:catechol 2,3-dioxygenase-like lactoylglutathione lyase family enzyme